MSVKNLIMGNKAIHFMINRLPFNYVRKGDNQITGRYSPFMFHSSVRVYGEQNQISLGKGILYKSAIYVEGNNNQIVIGEGMKLMKTSIWIKADQSKITIGENFVVNHTDMGIDSDSSSIWIGSGVEIGGFVWMKNRPNCTELARIYAGGGEQITIKNRASLSDGIAIRNSDSHTIYDSEGKIINESADILLGEDCWICSRAVLLKGSAVGDNSIVGGNAVVTKDFSSHKNVVIAGNPAKIIRRNIKWEL